MEWTRLERLVGFPNVLISAVFVQNSNNESLMIYFPVPNSASLSR